MQPIVSLVFMDKYIPWFIVLNLGHLFNQIIERSQNFHLIVTAQQEPQPQQQNNHDCSWVETK